MRCSATGGEGGEVVRALDIAVAAECRGVWQELRPDWVINGAAYTAVDRAESEPGRAWAVNAGAPAVFAEALQGSGSRILQLSTDFVFNGQQGTPYQPSQPVDPLAVYGASKADGQRAVPDGRGAEGRAGGLRPSRVCGPVGEILLPPSRRLMVGRGARGVGAGERGV